MLRPVQFYDMCPVCGRTVQVAQSRQRAYTFFPEELTAACRQQHGTSHASRPPAPETGATRRERIQALHMWAQDRLQHPDSEQE